MPALLELIVAEMAELELVPLMGPLEIKPIYSIL